MQVKRQVLVVLLVSRVKLVLLVLSKVEIANLAILVCTVKAKRLTALPRLIQPSVLVAQLDGLLTLAVPNVKRVVLVHLELGVNPAHWDMQEKETM